MSSEVGELVTGGLIAAAVEPDHGRTGAHHAAGPHAAGACLNCGAPLASAYCGDCGQSAHVHKTIGAIWHDLLHGVLHLDGKFFRTLPELALRPGVLTRRYIDGERAKFISPLALFLFSALLLYASYSIFGHREEGGEGGVRARVEAVGEDLQDEIANADERIADLNADLADTDLSQERRARLQARLAEAQASRAALAKAAAASAAAGAAAKAEAAPADEGLLKRTLENREFVTYKLKANAYKFSWALILISTPMVWLLFAWRRRFGLYDHAIFVTYSIAFMSLLFSAWIVAQGLGIGHGLLLVALMFYGLWHMYAQLKGAYLLSTVGAFWRVWLLYGIAATSGGMFYALITAVS